MILQKVYTDTPEGERLWSGFRLLKLAPKRKHNLNASKYEQFKAKGLMSITANEMIFHTVDGNMKFDIINFPCAECMHCGEIISYEFDLREGHPDRGKKVRAHVASVHIEQTCDTYPAGYKVRPYYELAAQASVPTIHPKAKALLNRSEVMRNG